MNECSLLNRLHSTVYLISLTQLYDTSRASLSVSKRMLVRRLDAFREVSRSLKKKLKIGGPGLLAQEHNAIIIIIYLKLRRRASAECFRSLFSPRRCVVQRTQVAGKAAQRKVAALSHGDVIWRFECLEVLMLRVQPNDAQRVSRRTLAWRQRAWLSV